MYEDFLKRLKDLDELLVLKFNHKCERWEIYRKERRVYPLGKIGGIVLNEMRDYPLFILRIQSPSGGFREPDEGIIRELQKRDRWRKERPILDFLLELKKAQWEEERQREKIWE